MVAAPEGFEHLLEMPLTPLLQNHLGTVHAAAQFALAEAASALSLQREFPSLVDSVFAVVRGSQLKYRKPATGKLLAFASPDDFTRENLIKDLTTRTRTTATTWVELKDEAGNICFAGSFEWFVARAEDQAK